MKTTKSAERTENILTVKDSKEKTISINLDNVDWWREDDDDSIEIHMKNSNFSLWVKISEESFRKFYLNYKKELKNN